ncbi:hypothetical protein Taro_040368 [Colocasia esculenta]|uniref:Uncharacterized protein n=1 Tax=Colocasia esculenta TaxID=4460 RepID=A0A843WY84_COLES|nr:hypothetical protein [Colocasia esculenta]
MGLTNLSVNPHLSVLSYSQPTTIQRHHSPTTLWVDQCSDKLGLSLELGSFAAGVMISTTDLSQHTLEQKLEQQRE